MFPDAFPKELLVVMSVLLCRIIVKIKDEKLA
ncbi:hypothetical protein cce_4878 [Crocosphaera subtropica ATCC 51142]|uniref:Uncharacterized protein n=1 Tax=Crocosphaera subtropica (strain ATCC 51142 / BH68) TaxID=43989 RepID=B1X264_CROS5|nr:hypothetical protein cce_4878 [Crocosphaera subtropica ATCC 51142]